MDILLPLFVSLLTAQVVSQKYACLKAEISENTLILECVIDRILFDVKFISPNGSLYGSCHAVTARHLEEREPIDCGNNITQYVDVSRTVLRLENPEERLGVWTCEHGTSWSNDTINITSSMLQGETTNGAIHSYEYCCVGLFISIAINLVVVVVFVLSNYEQIRAFVDRLKERLQMLIERRRQGTDSERENLLEEQRGICRTCRNETSYAICNCRKWFCEHCAEYHHQACPDHDIVQTRHEFKIRKRKLRCMNCSSTTPKKVCKECSDVFCDNCTCNHRNHSYKPILLFTPVRSNVLSEKVKYTGQKQLKHKYRLPSDDSDIIGLACLSNETIVAADYKNWKLHAFHQEKNIVPYELKMEPRALTKVNSRTIAISFAYKECIRIFEIQSDKIVENVNETIGMKDIGKPFNISYSHNFYAVEVGERKKAFIAVITIEGNGDVTMKYRIEHNDYSFGYFTGNTLRLALDMKKKLLYTSAIGKKSIYCVNFDGTNKWHIKVPSPREIHIIPSNSNTADILFASNKGNAVHQLKGNDESLRRGEIDYIDLTNEEDEIKNPEYIAYNTENNLLCVGMEKGFINVYHFPQGL